MTPQVGLTWQFLAGVWALFPVIVSPKVVSDGVPSETELFDSQSADKLSSNLEGDSNDSVSEFERNLRALMPGLQGNSSTGDSD